MQLSSFRSHAPSSLSASLWMYFCDVANTDLRQVLASAMYPASPNTRTPVRLLSCIASTRRGLPYIKEWVKLGARSRLNYQETLRWVPFWNSSPVLRELARAKPHALQKIYRPYLNDRFDCGQRLAIITSHYAFMLAHGFGPLLLRAARNPVTLCEIAGKSGDLYQIQLAAVGTLEREGELVLRLSCQGEELYSIAFTICVDGAGASIAVGCLQGPRTADSLERIRNATRDLHGLRPKSMMVRLVQQLGYHTGCRDLLLVGNPNLVSKRHIRSGKMRADYDTTWEELGATRRPDGDYSMPCIPLAAPDFEAIASKKRSEAKKRHALLESCAQLTYQGLQRS